LNNKHRTRQILAVRHGIAMGLAAFLIAVPVGLISQAVLEQLTSLVISVLVLLFIIFVGILFDVIGVAVTAAQEAPLHSQAAGRIFGARRAAKLVRNAHQVASFCNDVVGDVSGTLSGALGIAILYQLFQLTSPLQAILSTALTAAVVASLIVGGKAYGKVYAIRRSTEIVLHVGQVLTFIERFFQRVLPHRSPR
jgi:CBS domain containing-hemolysin-like protein